MPMNEAITMRPKATTGLLAAIVVLLAANLVMQNSEPAMGRPGPQAK